MKHGHPTAGAVDLVVGQRLTALRKAKGLSQTALGEAVGVTFQQVQKYEKGQNRVAAARLMQIAKVLDVPFSVFFEDGEASAEAGGESPLDLLGLPGAADLLQAYAGLAPEFRPAVVVLMRDLARAYGRPELVS